MSPLSHPSDEQLDAAIWCRHLIPDGSVYALLADHRHELFPPELFADLVVQGRSHPSVPAEVVATVLVLQALEGLSDREAVSALRRDIAWKVACGLRLDDEGFHPTVLVYWRNRIRTSPRPRRIFEAVRQVVEQTGVLTGRGRRVLDSTILADAVATQDTITQLVAAVRRVRRLVGPAREVQLGAHDYDRPGKPDCAWDDPQAKQALVSGLVNDALAVLAAVAEVDFDDEQAEAVALLALVAGQDVEAGERPGSWRIARKVAKDRYGAPRIHAELRRRGHRHGRKRIARLMRAAGLRGRTPRRWRKTTVPDPAAAARADLIRRDFAVNAAAVNTRWCGDITYIPTWEGWLYLATVIDIASRRVVGFALAEHLRTELVADALTNAVAARDPAPGLVFHADRGCQYTSGDYATLAADLTVTLSTGRTGQCWDNALAESFFSSLKGECLDQQPWPTRAAARRATVEYLAWYNGTRLHSALGYMTPDEFETASRQEALTQVA